MKILHKFYIGLVSAWKMFCAKVCAHGKLQVKWVNSIRGAFKIEVIGNGSIIIGRFLMSRGPLYLKSVNDGKLSIGDNVFFNHNCSITCAEKVTIGNHCMFANNIVIIDHDHVIGGNGVTDELTARPVVIPISISLFLTGPFLPRFNTTPFCPGFKSFNVLLINISSQPITTIELLFCLPCLYLKLF